MALSMADLDINKVKSVDAKQLQALMDKAKASWKSTDEIQAAALKAFGKTTPNVATATPTKWAIDRDQLTWNLENKQQIEDRNKDSMVTAAWTVKPKVNTTTWTTTWTKTSAQQVAENQQKSDAEKMVEQKELLDAWQIDMSSVPTDDKSQVALMSRLWQNLNSIRKDVSAVSQELWDTKWIFENKFNLAVNKATNLFDISQRSTDAMKDQFAFLEKQTWDTYKDIMNTISQQELKLEQSMNAMRDNLAKIAEWTKTELDIQQAAAGSAAEKEMRWMWWKASSIAQRNILSSQKRQNIAQMANLDVQLAQEANALEQNYLNLYNQISNNKNLTRQDKLNALNTLTDRANNLQQLQATTESDFTKSIYKPVEEEVAVQENIRNQQMLQEANAKRQNTSPQARESMIVSLIESAVAQWVQLPQEILDQVRNSSNIWDWISVAMNYVLRNVPRSQTNTSAIDKILNTLWQWGGATSWVDTSTTTDSAWLL